MKYITILAAITLTSCSTLQGGKLPLNSAISGTSGKGTVSVAVGGLTWKEALRKVGLDVAKAGTQLLADYAVAQLKGRLAQPSGK